MLQRRMHPWREKHWRTPFMAVEIVRAARYGKDRCRICLRASKLECLLLHPINNNAKE